MKDDLFQVRRTDDCGNSYLSQPVRRIGWTSKDGRETMVENPKGMNLQTVSVDNLVPFDPKK
jgi:hypothetical protein